MYRIVLICAGVAETAGTEGAACIQEEFALHRPWHQNVRCTFLDGCLTLTVENDFDDNGLASMDEFSDLISACIAVEFYGDDGDMRIQSITKI